MITTIDSKSAFVEGKVLSKDELLAVCEANPAYVDLRIISNKSLLFAKIGKTVYDRWLGIRDMFRDDAELTRKESGLLLPLCFLVEDRFLSKSPNEVIWARDELFNLQSYVMLVHAMLHGYAWCNAAEIEGIITTGKTAKLVFLPERRKIVAEHIRHMEDCRLQEMVKEMPVYTKDNAETGVVEGWHAWYWLTGDDSEWLKIIMDGKEVLAIDVTSAKHYDYGCMRIRLERISELCGGDKALKLLMELRKEWKRIKNMKTDFRDMSDADIADFENGLMNGFEDLIEEWEKEAAEALKKETKVFKKTRGRREVVLFEKDGKEDVERTKIEAERFIRYKNTHKWGKGNLKSDKGDAKLQAIVSFYFQWWKNDCGVRHPLSASGPAITRFLKEECGVEIEVDEKTFYNAIRNMIKERADMKDYKYTEIDRDVQTYFPKIN